MVVYSKELCINYQRAGLYQQQCHVFFGWLQASSAKDEKPTRVCEPLLSKSVLLSLVSLRNVVSNMSIKDLNCVLRMESATIPSDKKVQSTESGNEPSCSNYTQDYSYDYSILKIYSF